MTNPPTSMTRHFADMPDPRSHHRKRYPLAVLCTIAIGAVVCGAENWVAVAATTSVHHFIASVENRKASVMAQTCRAHWGVENRLHWRLDVTFNEDQSRLRNGHCAQNMSRLHRVGLNMLKQDESQKMGIKNKRLMAGWDHRFLLSLLSLLAAGKG